MDDLNQSTNISQAYNEFYSSTDWKENKLHTRLYIRSLLSLIKRLYNLRVVKIIDIGCGTGIYSYTLSKFGYEVHAVDYSEVAIGKAKAKYPAINFECQDASNLKLDQTYDLFFVKGFSLFNTTNFAQAHAILEGWNNYLSNNGVIVIQSRTDFSQTSPSNWYFHAEAEIERMFNISCYNFKLVFVYNKFQYLFLFPFFGKRTLNVFNWLSKNIIIGKFRKPANYFVFLTKKEISL